MTVDNHVRADTPTQGEPPKAVGRIRLGFAVFIASVTWPLLLPLMPLLGLSGSAIATFSGVMLVAAEVMMIAGAAIAGKDGFALIKAKVFGFLRSFGPPQRVGPTRYRVGIAMFAAPLLFAWIAPYGAGALPVLAERPLVFAVAGDLLLIASLFVLGGDFWDKLRALFIRRARVVMPDAPPSNRRANSDARTGGDDSGRAADG